MPSPVAEYTPIRARGKRLVHAVALTSPARTACGKRCSGWVVECTQVTCTTCKEQVHYPVKRRPRGLRPGT